MIRYEQLNCKEQVEIRQNALKYFKNHQSNIYQKIKEDTQKVPPSGNQLFTPESWDSTNWKWFLDNSFLL